MDARAVFAATFTDPALIAAVLLVMWVLSRLPLYAKVLTAIVAGALAHHIVFYLINSVGSPPIYYIVTLAAAAAWTAVYIMVSVAFAKS